MRLARTFGAAPWLTLLAVAWGPATAAQQSPAAASRQVATTPWTGNDTFVFASTVPATAGIDPAKLDAAVALAEAGGSDSLLVLVGGRVAAERYWNGKTADDTQQMFSATKSPFAFLVGRAMQHGAIRDLDQPLVDFLPELRAPGHDQLTFRNVMAMASGLEQSRELEEADGRSGKSQLDQALARSIVAPPFERYHYNNAAYRLLFYALEKATGKSVPELSGDELFAPLGMTGAHWMEWRQGERSMGYQSLRMRPRDLAKVGLVMLAGGEWHRERYLPADFVREMTTPPAPGVNPSYGLFWHLNGPSFRNYWESDRVEDRLLPGTPDDAFGNYGSGGQLLFCVPSLDLVWVRTGPSIPSTLWQRPSWVAELSRAIVEAVAASPR